MPYLAAMFSWPIVVLVAVLMPIVAFAITARQHTSRTRALRRVSQELARGGVVVDSTAFSLDDARHSVMVTSREVVIVDMMKGRVAQRFAHSDIRGLSVVEGGALIVFTLLLNNDAESRMIRCRSIVEFGRLFQFIASQGKHLRFVPENVA